MFCLEKNVATFPGSRFTSRVVGVRVDCATRNKGVILLCLDAGFVITSKLKESSFALQRSFVSPFVGWFSRGKQEVRGVVDRPTRPMP